MLPHEFVFRVQQFVLCSRKQVMKFANVNSHPTVFTVWCVELLLFVFIPFSFLWENLLNTTNFLACLAVFAIYFIYFLIITGKVILVFLHRGIFCEPSHSFLVLLNVRTWTIHVFTASSVYKKAMKSNIKYLIFVGVLMSFTLNIYKMFTSQLLHITIKSVNWM